MTDESKTVKLEPVAWASDTALALVARGDPGRLWPRYSVGSPHPLYGPEAAARIEELEADNARLIGLASQAQHNKNATERLLIDTRARLEAAVKLLSQVRVHPVLDGLVHIGFDLGPEGFGMAAVDPDRIVSTVAHRWAADRDAFLAQPKDNPSGEPQ